MVRKCMVLFCKNSIPPFFQCVLCISPAFKTSHHFVAHNNGIDQRNDDLTKTRHDTWLSALGRDPKIETLKTRNLICSNHFVDEDFVFVNNKKRLKQNVVPTVNLPRKFGTFFRTSDIIEPDPNPSTSLQMQNMNLNKNKENEPKQIDVVASTSQLYKEPLIGAVINRNIPLGVAHFVEVCGSNRSSPSSCITTSSSSPEVSTLKRKFQLTSSSDSEGCKGIVKKIRRNVNTFHNYSVTSKVLEKKIQCGRVTIDNLQAQVKKKNAQIVRLKRKVTHLKQIVWHLKKKNIVSDSAALVLEKSVDGVPLLIMRRYLANKRQTVRGKTQIRTKFPEELRSFALTLQFYSSKAYNYVRKVFNLCLPAPSTIRSWLSKINCEPGFSECSFITLKRIVENNRQEDMDTLCSLIVDEMSIKKLLEFKANKTWGYEDLGTGIIDDRLDYATEALVLLVVSVNGNWKLPVAYFLIKSLTGAEKANIVKQALIKLHNAGVKVLSVTCDGPSAHFAMAKSLGAEVHDIYNIKPYFQHPSNKDYKVYVIFDACHMIKLLRNNWAQCEIFFDNNGRTIDYGLIRKLHMIQENEFCKLGNKLSESHIKWQQQKMKVNLAAQTISNSIADAMEFLMNDIKHPDFKNSEGTINFLRIFDRTFDLCNSRNPWGKGSKAPLKQENSEYWRFIFYEALVYLKTLKTRSGKLLYKTKKRTPFMGFSVTIMSLTAIFDDYVLKTDSPLKYILSYKFSQDHIELFFCCIRAKNGWNNNPTAYQFYYTYKRLALRHDLTNIRGNCIMDNETNILTVSSDAKKLQVNVEIDTISMIKKYNMDMADMVVVDDNIEYYMENLPSLTLLTENVVTYIAGFVVKKIKSVFKCPECEIALETLNSFTVDCDNFMFLNRKNRGGLMKPSKDIIKICVYVEKKLRFILQCNNDKLPREKNFFDVFVNQVCTELYEQKLFESLDDHIFDNSLLNNHKLKLIKLSAQIYTKIRIYSIAKKQNERVRGELLRKKLSRLVIFHNQ